MDDFVVVLAGGRGERFWPTSRRRRPKQVLRLLSDRTMLRETIERTLPMVPMERTFIVTGADLAPLLQEMHPDIPPENYLVEPEGKNTAPAVCFAAAYIIARYGDGIMYTLASDHYIDPPELFRNSLAAAKQAAVNLDRLILLGIQPTRAETEYGYIQVGEKLAEYDEIRCMDVESFKEKPSRVRAQEFYLSGKYLWNSGNFIMRAGKVLDEAGKFLPELAAGFRRYIDAFGSGNPDEVLREVYASAPSISFDYAILEKSSDVAVLWGTFQWDDVGNWNALERVLERDRFNNVVAGSGKSLLLETYETTVYNDAEGLVVTFGISDVVVVRVEDVVLVMNKTKIPHLRELVKVLKENPDLEKFL